MPTSIGIFLIYFLLLQSVSVVSSLPASFCVDNTLGYVTSTTTSSCPPNTHALRAIGTNLFDIAWDAWEPSLTHGNLSTSLKAVRDAGAVGLTVARFFATPFDYSSTWGYLSPTTRPLYWAALDAVISEARAMEISLIPSLGYGCPDTGSPCNPSRLCPGETYRDLIINLTSCTRGLIFQYARDFVTRYKNESQILFWELGNELNLAWDACAYDKSPGAIFSSTEGLQFLEDYAGMIRSIEPIRPINYGTSMPRLRAKHLASISGGGLNCVSALNPKGDCDGLCDSIPYDSLTDTQEVLAQMYTNADIVSAHWYSCSPPNGNYSWCQNINSTEPVSIVKAAADLLSKPLYIGEFGPSTGHWSNQGGVAGGFPLISAMVTNNISLSTMWAFECPSHSQEEMPWCINPGDPNTQPQSYQTINQLQIDGRALSGKPPLNLTLTLQLLPHPRPGSNSDPACMDSTPYGYYIRLGKRTDKWLVAVQGGGWSPDLYQSWLRTQDSYVNSTLGSSRNWEKTANGQYFGPRFEEYSQIYLPYCDGSSFSSLVLDPQQTEYGPNKNDTLVFRGASNLAAALTDALSRAGVEGNITDVFVTGGSAGGMSTILHVDRIGELMGTSSIVGVPQCGYFLEVNGTCTDPQPSNIWCNASDQFKHAFNMFNASGTMSPACLEDHSDAPWRCWLPPIAQSYVNAPLFFWQSKFDHFQLSSFAGIDCAVSQAYYPPWVANVTCSQVDSAAVGNYGEKFMDQFSAVLSTPGPQRGVFLTSCVLHGMDANFLSVEMEAPIVAIDLWHRALRDENPPTVDNDFKWVEDRTMPRTDNPLACPPFTWT